MNEKTQEYLFFEINLTVVKCCPLDEINLTTCVRKPIEHYLTLENPTIEAVVYTISSNCQYMLFETPIKVPPLSEVSFLKGTKFTIILFLLYSKNLK